MHERTNYSDKSLGYTERLIVGRDTTVGARAYPIVKRENKEKEESCKAILGVEKGGKKEK
jgi:hypothetical protein